MATYHLVQVNIARMRAPLNSPVMVGFVARLDGLNALAESSPGFVWRLKGSGNNATDLRPYDDDQIILNMSVWESFEALWNYTYKSEHAAAIRQRRDWFEYMDTPILALWWIPAGHTPTTDEAKTRLERLHMNGPTHAAFTFKQRFEPPAD